MVNSLRRSLHTVLPRGLAFSFELTPKLFPIRAYVVDVTSRLHRL